MDAAKCSSLFNGKTKKASTNPVEASIYFTIQGTKCLFVFGIKHYIVVFCVGTVWLATTSKEASTFKIALVRGSDDHRTATLFAKADFFVRLNQINVCCQ